MRISDWSSDVCSSDLDWLFAPAVPVVQDARWGRTYESWSQDPALVREYAASYTRGLQGSFDDDARSEEHTSELQSLMRISYAVFCLKKKKNNTSIHTPNQLITTRNKPQLTISRH